MAGAAVDMAGAAAMQEAGAIRAVGEVTSRAGATPLRRRILREGRILRRLLTTPAA